MRISAQTVRQTGLLSGIPPTFNDPHQDPGATLYQSHHRNSAITHGLATPSCIFSLFLSLRSFVHTFLSLLFKACETNSLVSGPPKINIFILYYFVFPILRLFSATRRPRSHCRALTPIFQSLTIHHIFPHASSIITCFGSSFRTAGIFRQCCVKFKGGAMVDANAEADKPHQATTQQRTTTPKMSNRNFIISQRYLDPDVNHAAQSTGVRVT